MPILDITYAAHVPEQSLLTLRSALPHLVSLAVECPEEPYDGDLQPGDVDLRFQQRSPLDSGGLDVVITVHSKYVESRAVNRQERVDRLHEQLTEATGLPEFGIYLSLPVCAWAQTGD
ncbi:hypothetical protein D5S17_31795 [Pseudonocardiaceae bacterium YIM PH 21723]|nr:hypothetical protein D5S17_31795 [Pseudonocardiaceae bacterium YIM PH 21723]